MPRSALADCRFLREDCEASARNTQTPVDGIVIAA